MYNTLKSQGQAFSAPVSCEFDEGAEGHEWQSISLNIFHVNLSSLARVPRTRVKRNRFHPRQKLYFSGSGQGKRG